MLLRLQLTWEICIPFGCPCILAQAHLKYGGISHYPNFSNSLSQSSKQASLFCTLMPVLLFSSCAIIHLVFLYKSKTQASSPYPEVQVLPFAYSVRTESPKNNSSDSGITAFLTWTCLAVLCNGPSTPGFFHYKPSWSFTWVNYCCVPSYCYLSSSPGMVCSSCLSLWQISGDWTRRGQLPWILLCF